MTNQKFSYWQDYPSSTKFVFILNSSPPQVPLKTPPILFTLTKYFTTQVPILML